MVLYNTTITTTQASGRHSVWFYTTQQQQQNPQGDTVYGFIQHNNKKEPGRHSV